MKISVCLPIVFPGMPLDEALVRVSECGYRYAECWRVTEEEVAPLCVAMEKSGVQLLSIVADDFSLNIPQQRDIWLEKLRACAMRARRLHVPFIVTQVGQDNGAPVEEQLSCVREGLCQACAILEECGVTLLVEPLNTKVDHKGYLLEKSDDAFRLIRAVNSPRVRLVYDIYHQQISEGDILRTVCANLDVIAHLHGASVPGRHEIFLGENDYRFILREIENAGYSGAITLEYKPTLPPQDSLKQTLEYLKR